MAGNTNFLFNDCALISIATGQKAMTLTELRNNLIHISLDSIYHHFWGGLLVPRFEEREFNNDFTGWVRHSLRDPVLAERLAAIDPEGEIVVREVREAAGSGPDIHVLLLPPDAHAPSMPCSVPPISYCRNQPKRVSA